MRATIPLNIDNASTKDQLPVVDNQSTRFFCQNYSSHRVLQV